MATSAPVTSAPKQSYREFWKGKKSRVACFTIFDYNDYVVERLRNYATECRYLVFGHEIAPSTNEPHLQCFVCWETSHSIIKFHDTIWETKEFHIETKLKGTHQQAADYCKKEGNFEEFGTLPRQGERTDWCVAVDQLKSGTPVEEVVESQPQLLPCIRALQTFKTLSLKPQHRDIKVFVLWGDAGSGKSRWAYDNYPGLYSKPDGKWWDGYTGQTTILLDDFYGYIPHADLLKVLDRYPYQAEVKNGYVHAQWTTVIITSNKHPREWYLKGLTPALKRRLHKIFFYSIDAPPLEEVSSPPSS
jgi:hypothetical protein